MKKHHMDLTWIWILVSSSVFRVEPHRRPRWSFCHTVQMWRFFFSASELIRETREINIVQWRSAAVLRPTTRIRSLFIYKFMYICMWQVTWQVTWPVFCVSSRFNLRESLKAVEQFRFFRVHLENLCSLIIPGTTGGEGGGGQKKEEGGRGGEDEEEEEWTEWGRAGEREETVIHKRGRLWGSKRRRQIQMINL